ncbi:phosphoenolpyruvate synthase/pyruvate phosphate dikinase [Xenococcus sp. PCC 7305]|uniref:putative PEP-binding protein n=1 Tax=Xenococcus sp. PCC 7305 TaxID=102125 RepID=UPI0002ABDB72|nr:putative PEP-binding protein [Xenococcus sp. PCC 7305]ELS01788.1 phosphoenolpyruvate synthase/pyruvate phosphate dikinase [Xenococcus sp. PCC 7305]
MTWLYWLSQIAPAEESLVGEEIAVLSQLLEQGHSIVPGFTLESSLLTDFFANLPGDQFSIDDFSQSLSQIDIDNYQALQSLAQQSRQAIMAGAFPQPWQKIILEAIAQLNCSTVIVRPSLVISYAGEKNNRGLLRSQITGINPDAIFWGIKKAWAELFTAKSIFYWHKRKIELSQIKLTLLIQPCQNVQTSGSIELDKDYISIRSIWGLKQALDQGAVQPDIYTLNRRNSNSIEQQLGTQTIYYALKDPPENLAIGEEYLATNVVEDSLQEQAVLNEQQIRLLVRSAEKITSKNPKVNYLEWSIPQLTTEAVMDRPFYFHQLDFRKTYQINQTNPSSESTPAQLLLTGMAAAPGKVVGEIFVYHSGHSEPAQINPGSILVTNNIAPSDISLLKNLGGIITETGSLTSHGAIIARELGIPAIVNSENATKILRSGALVVLDGDQGKVYAVGAEGDPEISTQVAPQDNVLSTGIFDYPIGTKLMVNISQDNLLDEVAGLPIDGIGLLRSDLMLLDLLKYQTLEQWLQNTPQSRIVDYLVNSLRRFASKFAPRPIFYRSQDIPLSQLSSSTSKDSNLDNRGTAAYIQDPSFFDLELLALSRLIAEGFANVNLILPFVRNLEEFLFCRDRLIAQGLGHGGTCQLWIMAEVPSVLFLLPEYIKAGVQGFAIGTGDLTRLLFGLDREQIDLNQYYNNPAFKNAIAQIISLAKEKQIPCSICLHGTKINPELINNLINWGITTITVEPQAIREAYRVISRAERRLLLAETTQEHHR